MTLVLTPLPPGMEISIHFEGLGYEGLPQLTDVVRAFVDGEDARSSGGGSVGAGVARVPDVRRVGGDGVPTGGGRYDTADAEACSTSACSSSSLTAEESRQ